MIPSANRYEAAVVDGIEIFPVDNVTEAAAHLSGECCKVPCEVDIDALFKKARTHSCETDFSEIRGQEHAKRAFEIAAAGAHNLLLSGPPGAGKSMMAKAFPSILPDMTVEEALEVTKIYSVAGLLRDAQVMTERPFRSPHHTISNISLIGGGRILSRVKYLWRTLAYCSWMNCQSLKKRTGGLETAH